MKKVLPFALALILAGCTQEGQRLTSSQLTQFLSVERSLGFSSFRFEGNVVLLTDNTARLNIPSLGEDTGTWWIKDDTVCSQWNRALKRRAVCAHVQRLSDGTYAVQDPNTGLRLGTLELK